MFTQQVGEATGQLCVNKPLHAETNTNCWTRLNWVA
jgi:hypothetical protein